MFYNKTKKFLIVGLILIGMLIGQLEAQDEVLVNLFPDKANLWYFHIPEKGLNFYFLSIWPGNYLLTKFGPPVFKFSENFSLWVAVGPDLTPKAKNFKDLFESFTADIMPIISAGNFFAFFVNELGINRDGKFIHFLRHTVTYKNVGIRWMTSGIIGGETYSFMIGPLIQAKKLQLWLAKDTQKKKWTIEFSFTIKL